MTVQQATELRSLEGRLVHVALADGSRLGDARLMAASRHRADTIWLYIDGDDTFVNVQDIIDLWEAP